MTGIDISDLCAGARAVAESCFQRDIELNPSAKFASLLYLSQELKRKPIHVMFAYANRLYPIADWFRQLWAESLGKKYDLSGKVVNTGPTPVKAIGATDQHSQVQLYMEGPNDKSVIFLKTKSFQSAISIPSLGSDTEESGYLSGCDLGKLLNVEQTATAYALTKAQRPNMTIELDKVDPHHIGALLYLLESSVLYAGALYNVDPLDQPGVEQGKKATFALMGRQGYEAEKSEIDSWISQDNSSISLEL
jgi:glucose-6-phosphate isomerase